MAVNAAYGATLDYLFGRLPMYSRIGAAALKPDLTNTLALCAALGDPQQRFRSIHIAGTNGKGSTSHALAAILQEAGYKTGLYTSPHLVDFRERIRIDGVPVPEDFVVDFTARVKPLVDAIQPSFFELTVAMAFEWFATQGVDVAVIETGLGGRLDSTNIITPVLSVITHIALDHTDLLGDNLAQIASEKAGIIKRGVPVVIGRRQAETAPVFEAAATGMGAALHYAEDYWKLAPAGPAGAGLQAFRALQQHGTGFDLTTDLAGSYQAENLATVLAAAEVLQGCGFRVSPQQAAPALQNITGATGLRGRYEVLQESPRIVADVAHNPDGLRTVLQQFGREAGNGQKHILAGFVRDKDVAAALALFPHDAVYYWCNAAIPRALPVAELAAQAALSRLPGEAYPSVADALSAARRALGKDDALLIAGSFFVVGEALQAWASAG